MLTDFFYKWNPFNICGNEVGIEELLCNPLLPSETLRQDGRGHCRRIQVPSPRSPIWKKVLFWMQIHLNKKGHLEAIDYLISIFYQKLLQSPPKETQKLQELNLQIDQLRSLKNDHGFIHIKTTDTSFIDFRLKEISQQAYSTFTYHYKNEVIEQEKAKKKAFGLFLEQMCINFQELAEAHQLAIIQVRMIMMVPTDVLKQLIELRLRSIKNRLQTIQILDSKMNDMEELHQGQFTIPRIRRSLDPLRIKLNNELSKLKIEKELLIRNLILNYQLTPFKEKVKACLDSISIDPEENREVNSCASLFNRETAVQDDIVMQDSDLESLTIWGEYSQKVKASSNVSVYRSKSCVNLPSSTVVSRFKEALESEIEWVRCLFKKEGWH